MSLWDRLKGRISYGEKLHFTLLDPEKVDGSRAREWGERAVEAGTDAILIGGSTGFTRERMEEVVRSLADLPVPRIIFPSGPNSLVPGADAILFLSLLNSRDPRFIVGMQADLSILVRDLGLEAIPVGYVIIEPGMKVGEVGRASPVERGDSRRAVSYALAAQFLGMEAVYLEAGSGAPEPVPPQMVKEVSDVIDIVLIVGGGVRDSSTAMQLSKAGADILVTGTVVEATGASTERLASIIRAFKGD